MTVEIHGTGTHNRGAELMAIAIAERLRSSFPRIRLAVPSRFGSSTARLRHGFHSTTDSFSGRRFRLVKYLAGDSLERWSGILPPEAVDLVLDASGFAFSDKWGVERSDRLLRKMTGAARRHQPLVLLPQALGPFTEPKVVESARRLFERASLVCARDSVSYEAAAPLVDGKKLRLFPDFTGSVSSWLPRSVMLPDRFCAIVPNIHMVDMTESGDQYLLFLCHVIEELGRRQLNPCFVLHDAHEDRKVVEAVAARGHSIPVLEDPDPRILKGMLGRAHVVIASRFHALVSALSQGVPCIGAGWAHKYPELFSDFDCPDLLVSDLTDLTAFDRMLVELTDPTKGRQRRSRIEAAADRIKARTLEMWSEVEAVIAGATR